MIFSDRAKPAAWLTATTLNCATDDMTSQVHICRGWDYTSYRFQILYFRVQKYTKVAKTKKGRAQGLGEL